MDSIRFPAVTEAVRSGVPAKKTTFLSQSKVEPQDSATSDTLEMARKGPQALALKLAGGLKLPQDARKEKISLNKLGELPPEILAHILQIALNIGVEVGVLAVLSTKILDTTVDLIASRLSRILAQAKNSSSPISVVQWLEAKKLTLLLANILKVSGAVKLDEYLSLNEQDVKSLLNHLHTIGADAVESGLATWCEVERTSGNLNAETQAINFVTVYKKSRQNLIIDKGELYTIPEQIGFLQNLKILYFAESNLSKIPQMVYELKHLKSLCLKQNKISVLSSDIKLLTNLKSLDISYNDIKELPVQIGNLPALGCLDATCNDLEHITVTAGQFKKLEFLFLRLNPLLTELPEELAKLPHLLGLNIDRSDDLQIPLNIQENIDRNRYLQGI